MKNDRQKKITKRSKEDSGKLRQDILDVAARLFKNYGYEGTTLAMIAEKLNITQGAVSYHFQNKHLIMFTIFESYFKSLHEFVQSNLPDDFNYYLYYCIVNISSFRTIMMRDRNWKLFYQKEHLNYWITEKMSVIEDSYKKISDNFIKDLTEEEIHVAAIMDMSARAGLFEKFKQDNFITADRFCYYLVYHIGVLSRLDDSTIQKNIDKALEFLDSHEMPTIFLLE